jgi:hypothetical protein
VGVHNTSCAARLIPEDPNDIRLSRTFSKVRYAECATYENDKEDKRS